MSSRLICSTTDMSLGTVVVQLCSVVVDLVGPGDFLEASGSEGIVCNTNVLSGLS